MNEPLCAVCFKGKGRYIRECKCLYCAQCFAGSVQGCPCGGGGRYIDLSQTPIELVKLLNVTDFTLYKRAFESCLETALNVSQNFFLSLQNEIIAQSDKHQLSLKTLNANLIKAQKENSELKGKSKENKLPTPLRPVNAKQNFDFEPFDSFFKKQF